MELYRVKKSTIFLVILMHLFFYSLLLPSKKNISLKNTGKIHERTIKVKPQIAKNKEVISKKQNVVSQPKKIITRSEKSEEKDSPPIEKKKTFEKSLKKGVTKVVSNKKTTKAPISATKKTISSEQKDSLTEFKQIDEMTAKINKSLEKLKSSSLLKNVKHFDHFTIQAEMNTPILESEKDSFFDLFLAQLRQNLTLPEYGFVKVELQVDFMGKVFNVKVLEKESEKNAEYLKKMLPACSFSCLNEWFKGQTIHTFTILFTNEM